MSDEELKAVVDIFRQLKQWRDEEQAAKRQALIRTGTDALPVRDVRIH